ncbi:MAG TPA: hypothetical protein VK054_13140 [Beutenbergiaceae bacterium]|nr:hypothetical protein [Beutenbergiaceae bacterium]
MKPVDDPAILLAVTAALGFTVVAAPVVVAVYMAARVHRSRQERR